MVCATFDCGGAARRGAALSELATPTKVSTSTIAMATTTHIGAFQFKVCEVESDSVLRRRHDFPDAVFIRRI